MGLARRRYYFFIVFRLSNLFQILLRTYRNNLSHFVIADDLFNILVALFAYTHYTITRRATVLLGNAKCDLLPRDPFYFYFIKTVDNFLDFV